MRRLLKFLHSAGAAGLTGGLAAVAVILLVAPTTGGAGAATPLIVVTARIAAWIIGPSLVVTVISGLLAIAANPIYQDAGWVWAKVATGILILEGGLHVLGPIQSAAKRGAEVLADGPDPAAAAKVAAGEVNTLWVLLGVCVANIALGVWRPKFPRIPL